MTPLVSIITPCYNAEAVIEETIASVIIQSYKNWELIIIDDASTDNSEKIITEFLTDKRISYLKNSKNSGVSFTRNRGMDIAKGDFIAFLDSDDIWEPSKLTEQLTIFKNNPQTDIVCSSLDLISESGEYISTINIPKKISLKDELKSSRILTSAMIFNYKKLGKNRFKQIGHEDYLFKLELLMRSKASAISVDKTLVKYRIVNNSLSHNKVIAAKWQWNIYRKHLHFPIHKTVYYFLSYIISGIIKYMKRKNR